MGGQIKSQVWTFQEDPFPCVREIFFLDREPSGMYTNEPWITNKDTAGLNRRQAGK
jgi:hypothetical protein